MKKIKVPLLLLTISLSFLSCNDGYVTEQCSPFLVLADTNPDYISVNNSKCYCRTYEFKKAHVGSVGNAYEKPLMYCQKLVGFPINEYAGVASFWEYVRKKISEHK